MDWYWDLFGSAGIYLIVLSPIIAALGYALTAEISSFVNWKKKTNGCKTYSRYCELKRLDSVE